MAKIKIDNETGCWNWTAGIYETGYGHFKMKHSDGKQKKTRAHRVSWMIFKGDIPEDMLVLHNCDNKICVNPDHLFIGTQQDNINDMISKGREKLSFPGELSPQSKLTNEDVRNIRNMYKIGIHYKEIMALFNISDAQFYRIKNRHCWSHLPKIDYVIS